MLCFQSAVSENKVLCHPASIDSLTTSAGTEDHVSMGGFAARKCLRVVEHVEQGKNEFAHDIVILHTFFFFIKMDCISFLSLSVCLSVCLMYVSL